MSSPTITDVHRCSSTYFSQGDHSFGKRLSSPSLASIALTTASTTNTNSDFDYETSSEGFHSPRGQHALPFSKIPNTPTAALSSCSRTLDPWGRNPVSKFSSEPFVTRDNSQKILCRKFANFNSPMTLEHISDTSKVKSLPEMGMDTWCNSKKFPGADVLPTHDFMELRRHVGDFMHEKSTDLQMLSDSASVTESHYECDKKNDTEVRFTISNSSVVFHDGCHDEMQNAISDFYIREKCETSADTRSSMAGDSLVKGEICHLECSPIKRKKKYALLSTKSEYFSKHHNTFKYYPVSRIEGEFAPLQNKLSEIQGKVRALSLGCSMADCAKRTSNLQIGVLDGFSFENLEKFENLKMPNETQDEDFDVRTNYLNNKSNNAKSLINDQLQKSSICTTLSMKVEDTSRNINSQKEDIKRECKEHLESSDTKQNYQSEEISLISTLTILAQEYAFSKDYPATNKDESLLNDDNLSREISKNYSDNTSEWNDCDYKISTSITDETEKIWPKEYTRGMRSYPYQ